MKKSVLLSFSALAVSLALFTSCGSKAAKGNLNLPAVNVETVSDSTELYEISVDPRLELIGMIVRKAGFEQYNNPNFNNETIIASMDTWFEKYKNEPAIKTAKSFKKKIKYYDNFNTLVDYIKPDFSGEALDLNDMPENIKKGWGKVTPAELEKFIVQINDLARKCDLNRIYLLNKGEYINMVAYMKNVIVNGGPEEKIKAEQWLKEFHRGYKPEKTHIYISSFLSGYSYYGVVKTPDSLQKVLYFSPYMNSWALVLFTNAAYARCMLYDSWDEIGPVCQAAFTKFIVKNNITNELDLLNQMCWLVSQSWNGDYIEKCWNTDEKNGYVDSCKKNLMLDQFLDMVEITEKYVQNPEQYKNVSELLPEYKKILESF